MLVSGTALLGPGCHQPDNQDTSTHSGYTTERDKYRRMLDTLSKKVDRKISAIDSTMQGVAASARAGLVAERARWQQQRDAIAKELDEVNQTLEKDWHAFTGSLDTAIDSLREKLK